MARVSILQYSQPCRSGYHLIVVYTPVAMDFLGRMDIYYKKKASEETRSSKYAMLDRHNEYIFIRRRSSEV